MSSGARLAAALAAGAVGPGSLMGLHLELKRRLAEVAARFWQLETKTSTRAPTIVDGWVAPKPGAEAEQFPFLIVRPRTGGDSEQGADQNATAVIDVVIGTYSDTDDGWFDVVLLIDAIRADLDAAPAISGTAFEHTGPLTWELLENQPRPQWFGTVKTNWTVPRPVRAEARNPEEG